MAIGQGKIVQRDGRWLISGDWTLEHYAIQRREIERVRQQRRKDEPFNVHNLGRLDTAGAGLLSSLLSNDELKRLSSQLPPEQAALLQIVAEALRRPWQHHEPRPSHIKEELAQIGAGVEALYRLQLTLLGFVGLTLEALAATIWRPRRWRVTSLFVHMEQTGFNALPIVTLLTFMVGAVVAFLGARVLAEFGATVFTVNLVAFSFLREFGVLLTAILVAGRTGSAFAAHIGSMKANEEIDAIRTLGLNPVELLVLPRVIAMMITLPILTFVAMISGIAGGLVVCMTALDISPLMYLTILQRDIDISHFFVGMSKAPVFAFVIAVIGCLEGFKVEGSARSVGEHTTSSVVQSIFMVIFLDALAALFFMEMGW